MKKIIIFVYQDQQKIFLKKFKNIKISKIKDCIDKSRKILTGTSWPSRFEIQAIILAKKKLKLLVT